MCIVSTCVTHIAFFSTAAWIQEVQLKGDYYAQNYDAKSPGELAPWYPRFGHSLTAINQSSYSLTQGVMILTGGYTPQPSNDVWVTPDGITWYYTGLLFSCIFIIFCQYFQQQSTDNMRRVTLYSNISEILQLLFSLFECWSEGIQMQSIANFTHFTHM